jgi:hypothetical protein
MIVNATHTGTATAATSSAWQFPIVGFRRSIEQAGGSLAGRGKDSSGITQPEGVLREPRATQGNYRQATLHGVVFDILGAGAAGGSTSVFS